MPITLGCPSCGKRFRAKDESAGKRVKCPHCGAPVSVPTPEESAAAGAPTMSLPPPPAPARPAKPSAPQSSGRLPAAPASAGKLPAAARPAPVASPDDWGASELPKPHKPYVPPPPPPPAPPPYEVTEPSALDDLPKPGSRPPERAPARRPGPRSAPGAAEGAKTPDQLAAPGWRKTRAGLSWVLFALFLLALPGFVGFAKAVCVRAGVDLPRGPGGDWISISGYLNSPEPNAVKVSKEQLLDAVLYGVPVFMGGLFLAFGRLTCGAAPRSSGAKGMFALSGVFTFAALAGLVFAVGCYVLLFEEEYKYARPGVLIVAAVAEFWFLTALAASGSALKRPRAARAVGLLGFFVALMVAFATIGWRVYEKSYRPTPLTDDAGLYEHAAQMLGWLLVVGLYWRAVGAVRAAISDFLVTFEE